MSLQIVKAERQCFLSWSKMKTMCLVVCHLRAERKRNMRKGRKEQGKGEEAYLWNNSKFTYNLLAQWQTCLPGKPYWFNENVECKSLICFSLFQRMTTRLTTQEVHIWLYYCVVNMSLCSQTLWSAFLLMYHCRQMAGFLLFTQILNLPLKTTK